MATRTRASTWTTALLAVGVVALGVGFPAALWFVGFDTLSADAIDYAATARNLAEGAGYHLELIPFHPGSLPTVTHLPEWHGLLRPFELAPIFLLFGAGDALVKVPNMLYAGGIVLVAYALGRRLSGQAAGYLAAALVMSGTDLGIQTVSATDDVGSAFWVLLTLYFADRQPGASPSRWAAVVGAAAGFGTLEKFTGVLLPVAIVAALLLLPAARDTVRLRHVPLILGPSVLAAGLYFLRNYLVYGAFDFRFTALEWLSKELPSAYFYYYPVRPTVSWVWSQLGIRGVLHGIGIELGALLRMAVANWWLVCGGLLALIVVGSKAPRLAGASLVFGLLLVASICTGHQFEPRYVLSFVCVEAVAVAVVVAEAALRSSAALPSRGPSAVRGALTVVSAWYFVALAASTLPAARNFVRTQPASRGCPGVFDYVRHHVAPEQPILTTNPWLVVWRLRHPAVMVPSNGPTAIEEVARHYGTHFALVGVEPGWPAMDPRYFVYQLRRLTDVGSVLQPRVVATSDTCDLYFLH